MIEITIEIAVVKGTEIETTIAKETGTTIMIAVVIETENIIAIMAAKEAETVIESAVVIKTGNVIEIVIEKVIVTIAENGKTVADAEDRKQDRLARSMIIVDAEIKKIIRNWCSKHKTLSRDRMRKRKTVGVQSLPFYFLSRSGIIQ